MQDGNTAHWEDLATKYWLNSAPTKVKAETIKTEIWDPLERDSFSYQSLLPLESLQILERFLWPTYSSEASNHHVRLIAIFFNVKQRGKLQDWGIFENRPTQFSNLFKRILSLNLDKSLSISARLPLLTFVIGAFHSLEKDWVRKECAPLVSISIWHNLHSEDARERRIENSAARKRAWRLVQKRFESADQEGQAKLRFERSWLFSMLLDFLSRLNAPHPPGTDDVVYCERLVEFLIDLISQLPTRRYTNKLINDLNILPALKTSKLLDHDKSAVLRDLSLLLLHFQTLGIEDSADEETSQELIRVTHYEALSRLQRIAHKHFGQKLKVLALANYASIDQRSELQSHFSALSDEELEQLCVHLGFRTSYPASVEIPTGRKLYMEVLLTQYSRPQSSQQVMSQFSALPTEKVLYDPSLLRNEDYDGSRPISIPKLNLQYLTLGDFMWRSFQLQQAEAFYGIRKDMESVIRRLKPRRDHGKSSTGFGGFTKMAIPIDKPAIIEVGPPKVGSTKPSFVRGEVVLDVSRLHDSMRREWDSLRPKDVVFLLAIETPNQLLHNMTNGHKLQSAAQELGLKHVRSAEVVQILDDNGRPLRDNRTTDGYGPRPRRRRLLLDIDAAAYQADKERLTREKSDIYASINVLARRQGRENNFKPILETVQKLVSAKTSLPLWLHEVFLGYGDPKSASFPNLQNHIRSVDFLDTFLDWQHLCKSFPDQSMKTKLGQSPQPEPPYVLEQTFENSVTATQNPKKRTREQMEEDAEKGKALQVSTYEPPNSGPYPIDIPKKNNVRFTPKQVEAIVSGTQPGLTVIVGPPGTGKTDVATQIINLLYHNFPSERILLIAHSNQALNQLFQKIIALDIDSRHLLRLGRGEEDLDTDGSYSKHGRVEFFLENRQTYLAEVARLAASIGAEGAHGSSCETADYFNQVFIKPAWILFWEVVKNQDSTPKSASAAFPFHTYFSNAPIFPLFPEDASVDQISKIVSGCQHHINKIFSELESIRPFEILRNNRDQANHLLVKEARIIAMTSTHAAIRQSEIADLGFHYDTLVMEEAAQVTEIESFIPCAMQNPDSKTGELPLKRIVLVGDHLQNSPVIQNMALRQYANFEQSLFLRLVRLGVPTIHLDQQGRCRPSIAELFKWRYINLGNLPHLQSLPEFSRANAGFRYEYQFIDVPDYQGQGEREPTPHFIQNVGEAEYTVALYQYMRLLGYPARSISILATYAGQRALIRDVLEHRCKGNRLFGLPRIVTTVDKYQGEQNDYVILSLTRTRSLGYLRDVRRLTVALSRARLGLYILGRRELFETCFEMKPAMDLLLQRPDKLVVTTGEMFPADRKVDATDDDQVEQTEMQDVEHLGQYVYEMSQAKIKALGGQITVEGDIDGRHDARLPDPEEEERVDEQDPLYEIM